VLILVRHGESVWNADDRFAGWVDVALTRAGREETRAAGRWLYEQGIIPTVVHASLLARARNSADLMLDACGAPEVPVLRTERLNERHYGALQGMPRAEAVDRYGAVQVTRWRRGIGDRPPADAEGRGESLADVRVRLWPYVDGELFPALDAGHTVLVVSHGNTLRMLVQVLEGLRDEQTAALDVPTGGARVYATVNGVRRVG
jgi:2,3-bisphosphoglycerate-dependent phosphoglycerate mutase